MAAKLVVKAGLTDKAEYALDPGRACIIGRSRDANVIVKDQQSSRHHCKLEASPAGEWTLSDLNSSNGTYVNRHRVTTHPLRAGDLVQVGKAIFEFGLAGAAVAPAPAPEPEPAPTPAPAYLPAEADAGASLDATPPPPPPALIYKDQSPTDTSEAKAAGTDQALKDLFAFLDRIDANDRSGDPKRRAPRPAEPEPAPRPAERAPGGSAGASPSQPAAPAHPAPPAPANPPAKDDSGAFLELVKHDEPPAPQPPRGAPAPEEKKERGGLLAFLRKKKQP